MKDPKVVAGFMYWNDFDTSGKNGQIVTILSRGLPDPADIRAPVFLVQWDSGDTEDVLGSNLQPWYLVSEP